MAFVAELPSSLSDSSNSTARKFSEGPTYATVHFHNNGSSCDDADPKIRLEKEVELCEYATVRYNWSA